MCKDKRKNRKLIAKVANLAEEAYALYEGNDLTTIAIRMRGETTLQVINIHRNSWSKGVKVKNWMWDETWRSIWKACRVPDRTYVRVIKRDPRLI